MVEITLHDYLDEIEGMINEARYIEALAHLRHILARYPRLISAYYMMGRLMLEVDLPELAADMFRRALAADPEHLFARIGLGEAHERLNHPQAALWNLTRALELDPSNEAIADEVRRLHAEIGQPEPRRLPLTRAALARLYVRGKLYNRAIIELDKLIQEEPQRPDLLLLKAEAHWQNGQTVQASDLCQQILSTYPYCLKANLLLGYLWTNAAQEEGRRYLKRAHEMDPENVMAVEMFGNDSPLPREEVRLERLTYEPQKLGVNREAPWYKQLEASSVTIGVSEALPEMSETEMKLVNVTADLESQLQIPDWLKELGALEEEAPSWLEEAEAEGGEEELQSWLESATLSDLEKETLQPAEEEETPPPDWLQQLQETGEEAPAEGEAAPDWLEEVAGAATEEAAAEIPDWLKEMGGPGEAPAAEAEAPAPAEEVPDWLQELQPPAEAAPAAEVEAPAPAEEVPDWLKDLEAPAEETPAAEVEAPAPAEEMPDWLKELEAPAEAQPAGPQEAEGLFGWESFAAEAAQAMAEEQEETEAEMEAPSEEGAFGFVQFGEQAEELGTEEVEAPPAEEESPAEEIEFPVEGELLSGDEALSLLAGLAKGKEEELRAQAEAEAQARVDAILGRKRPAEEEAPAEEIELPVEGELLSGDEALSLLAGLAEGKEEELRAQAEAEAQARVDAILGRKRPAEEAAPVEEAKPAEAAQPPVAEAEPAEEETVAEGEEELFGWTHIGEPVRTETAPLEEEKEPPPAFGFLQFEGEAEEVLPAGEEEGILLETAEEAPQPVVEEAVEPAEMSEAEAPSIQPKPKPVVEERVEPAKTPEAEAPSIQPQPAPEAPKAPPRRKAAPAKPKPAAPGGDLDALRAYVKKHRSDHAARLELAQALWKAGEHEEALKHYSRLIRAEKMMEQVFADLTAYVEANPADARLLRTLGDAYMKSGDLNQAMALYKQAMDLL